MKGNLVAMPDINNKPSKEEIAKRIKRNTLLKELGLLGNYDSNNTRKEVNELEKLTNFSKYYNTIKEFRDDRYKALSLIYNDKEITKELFDKLVYTKKEVKEKYNVVVDVHF